MIVRDGTDSDRSNVLCIDRTIALEDEDIKVITDDLMQVLEVGKPIDPKRAFRAAIGIEKINAKTCTLLFFELSEMTKSQTHVQDYCEAAYAPLVEKGTLFRAPDITGLNWTAIDTPEDFSAANEIFGSPITTVSRGQQRALDEAAEKRANPT